MHIRSKLARNVQNIHPIKDQSITLSTNHMRAFKVVNHPETGFKHPLHTAFNRGQPGVNLGSTWGQPGVKPGLTWGLPGVNPGSTRGQPGVNPGSTWV